MQNPSANLIFILFLFAILYFLMWRPQQRRIRAMQALQSSLQLGDEIITSAGFLGTIRRFDGEVVTIELSPPTWSATSPSTSSTGSATTATSPSWRPSPATSTTSAT